MQDLSVLLLISLEIWQPESLTQKDKIKSYLKYCGRRIPEHWGEGELQQEAAQRVGPTEILVCISHQPVLICIEAKGPSVGRLTELAGCVPCVW